MRKDKFLKNVTVTLFWLAQIILLIVSVILLTGGDNAETPSFSLYTIIVVAVIYCFIVALTNNKYFQREYYKKERKLNTNETLFMTEFVKSIRACYSYDDFYEAIQKIIESKANSSVLYIDCERNTILYHSNNKIVSDIETFETVTSNYYSSWPEGYFFFDDQLNTTTLPYNARGFFLSSDNCHFFIFCKYTRLFSEDIFSPLFDEFKRFQNRMKMMSQLTEMERITHEWNHLNDIQKKLLNKSLPETKNLSISSWSKSDVERCGSFFMIQAVSEGKTLVVFSDVTNKGLTALIIMSLISNTLRISPKTDSVVDVITRVNKAVDSIDIKDKQFCFFVGLFDTNAGTLSYINAGLQTCMLVNEKENQMLTLETAGLELSESLIKTTKPVVQPIHSGFVFFITSNDELCMSKDFSKVIFINSEHTSSELIDVSRKYLKETSDENAADNIAMLAVKVD